MNFIVTEEMINNSIVSKGDISKIVKLMDRGKKGENITVAFLGGSITQGCNATLQEDCYANRTYLWFKKTFKDINVKYVNAGVGATGSILGVHRVETQILAYDPDIVFIDFAVNDTADVYNKIAYESLIRRLLSAKKEIAIVEIFMSTDTSDNVQEQQIEIGEKYNIPMISYRNTIHKEIINNRLKWEDVATDNVHPNDYGHYIISELLINFLENIYENLERNKVEDVVLGEPVFGEKYIKGEILNNINIEVKKKIGFAQDNEGFQVFHNGWKFISAESGVANLNVELVGKNIFLLFKKSISEASGKIEITVDHGERKVLDTYFKDGWGDFSETELLIEEEESSKHVIQITVKDENKSREIFIMGFLVS